MSALSPPPVLYCKWLCWWRKVWVDTNAMSWNMNLTVHYCFSSGKNRSTCTTSRHCFCQWPSSFLFSWSRCWWWSTWRRVRCIRGGRYSLPCISLLELPSPPACGNAGENVAWMYVCPTVSLKQSGQNKWLLQPNSGSHGYHFQTN